MNWDVGIRTESPKFPSYTPAAKIPSTKGLNDIEITFSTQPLSVS